MHLDRKKAPRENYLVILFSLIRYHCFLRWKLASPVHCLTVLFIVIIIINHYYYWTGIASTPFKQTATKAHAVVNKIQLNSSVFSSFLNIVKDRDGSLRTGCRLFVPGHWASIKNPRGPMVLVDIAGTKSRGIISTFSWGGQNFFLFLNATGLLKNWKKQHFICSNLTSFIVPFFLFLFFFSFFLFFLFFFLFFLFFFFLGGRRPPKWRLWWRGRRMQPIADDNIPGAWRPLCVVQCNSIVNKLLMFNVHAFIIHFGVQLVFRASSKNRRIAEQNMQGSSENYSAMTVRWEKEFNFRN